MSKKKLTPEEKVKAIQDVRDYIWKFQREHFDADIEQPILAMDKILRKAQEKTQVNPHPLNEEKEQYDG